MPYRLVKLAAEEISAPLNTIINRGIKVSTFQAILKCAYVIPVYEKGQYEYLGLLTSKCPAIVVQNL